MWHRRFLFARNGMAVDVVARPADGVLGTWRVIGGDSDSVGATTRFTDVTARG
ncbi:hypothetical protein [Saccharothrix yanglingensis]|uniref:hypothetical protein n=1 Tax=Saccharothrix yanglingensis TaxID=659496 RepID=UPI0027D22DDD|nr:hypothetical protein [Saccharothrix yanglingensis]